MFYGGAVRRQPTAYLDRPCRTALQRVRGMPFSWSLNPYIGCVHRCTFCYVRAFEQRADRPADDRYGRTVTVKTNVVDVLRHELTRPSWRRELVCMGTATDPYQPIEGSRRLTQGCLRALVDFRTPVTITTRGPLVVRDVELLSHLAQRAGARVCISLPSLDSAVISRTEPGTAPPQQRLRALRRLVDGGVEAGLLLAPILPGISDDEAGLRAVAQAAADAGARFLWATTLNLRPGTRDHFLEALARDWPQLLPRYEALYAASDYLPAAAAAPPMHTVEQLRRSLGLEERRERPAPGPRTPTQLPLGLGAPPARARSRVPAPGNRPTAGRVPSPA
jgi:DNA repair photolyase